MNILNWPLVFTLILGVLAPKSYAGPILYSSIGKKVTSDSSEAAKTAPEQSVESNQARGGNPGVVPATWEKIQADFKSALDGSVAPNVGDIYPWAGGTLTRVKTGELYYQNGYCGNGSINYLNPKTDLVTLARQCPAVNDEWVKQYGVSLATADNANQQEGSRVSISHVYTHGLNKIYNKTNPYWIGYGAGAEVGACNENGKVVFYTKREGKIVGGPYDYPELVQTNEYKALAGENIAKIPPAAVKEIKGKGELSLESIRALKESSIDMLVKARAKYRAKEISKEEYIKIADQVVEAEVFEKKYKEAR